MEAEQLEFEFWLQLDLEEFIITQKENNTCSES